MRIYYPVFLPKYGNTIDLSVAHIIYYILCRPLYVLCVQRDNDYGKKIRTWSSIICVYGDDRHPDDCCRDNNNILYNIITLVFESKAAE